MPRETLFHIMRSNWAISNMELARAVLLEKSVTNGKSPQELIEVRSSLSRYVVHVRPGEYTFGWLAQFDESVAKVMNLVKRSDRPHSDADIVSVLSGLATDEMRQAFDEAGLDGALFTNASKKFATSDSLSTAHAAQLLVALFVVAGCSGSPAEAVEFASNMADDLAGTDALQTALPTETPAPPTRDKLVFGAYRCVNDVIVSGIYRFDTSPQGTEIGSLSIADGSINNVGDGVSRRHARIWRDRSNNWWAEDLGSTNGTVHVSGIDGSRTAIKPRRSGQRGDASHPVRLIPGDRLVLAGTTEFIIVALPSAV